jgi:hypothetical protein
MQDRVKDRATGNYASFLLTKDVGEKHPIRTVPDAAHFLVVENAALVEVHESLGLLPQCRREAVSVGLVVRKFRVNEVVDLEHSKQMFSTQNPCTLRKPDAHIPL